jgi:hypothetical protein
MTRVSVRFGGERVKEVVAAVGFSSSAQAVFPGSIFGGYLREY